MSNVPDDLFAFIHALPDFLIVQDGEGRWITANEAALRVLRLSGAAYQGKRTNELLQGTDERTGAGEWEQPGLDVWTIGTWVGYECRIALEDGSTRMYEMRKIPVFDEAGARKWLVLQGRDITFRSRLEEEITLASKVFESVSDGIFVTDVEGTILSVNPAFTTVTGYSEEEVIGKNPRLLKSGRQGPHFYRQMWAGLLENGFWQGEIWNRRKNGRIYPESLTINAIKDKHGKTTNYVATFRDISEREQVRKDVMLTGKIQRKFLPPDFSDDVIAIRTFFKPSQYVSGDLYDYTWLKPGERLAGYLIDIMGHGLSTALQTSVLRVLLMQASTMELPLYEKMAWINREALKVFAEDTFAAAICFEFDFVKRQLTYVSCGINYFMASTRERNGLFKVPGTFLGLSDNVAFEEQILTFESGDSFYFMTDGVFDKLLEDVPAEIPPFEVMNEKLKRLIFMQTHKDDATAITFQIQ